MDVSPAIPSLLEAEAWRDVPARGFAPRRFPSPTCRATPVFPPEAPPPAGSPPVCGRDSIQASMSLSLHLTDLEVTFTDCGNVPSCIFRYNVE